MNANKLSKPIAMNLFEAVTNDHMFLPITKVTHRSLTHPCKASLDLVCLQFVIVVFPDHAHLLFLKRCLTVLILYIRTGVSPANPNILYSRIHNVMYIIWIFVSRFKNCSTLIQSCQTFSARKGSS